ncbi:MAG: YraN family protein [Actinomycetota bacterium]|nr:YraN family protein [Actinomycetota bacterium]
MAAKDGLGRYGEDVAVQHLERGGLRVVSRNWRCNEGELDVVGYDGDVLVVVEVKTRSGVGFGSPAEAVTGRKAQRIRRLACRWLMEHRPQYSELRFDVVSVLRPSRGAAQVEHLRGAF